MTRGQGCQEPPGCLHTLDRAGIVGRVQDKGHAFTVRRGHATGAGDIITRDFHPPDA